MQKKRKKHAFEINLLRFVCTVTLKSGKIKYIYIDLPPIVKHGGKGTHKDTKGNIFEYDLIHYENKVIQPKIDFELFSKSERKFSDSFKKSYFNISSDIELEISEKELEQAIGEIEMVEKLKSFIKSNTRELPYEFYYEEFENIYKNNVPNRKNINNEELQALRQKDLSQRFTRKSAFLILLFRHKKDKNFLLECDFTNSYDFEELFAKFYESFKKRPKQ